MKLNAVCVIEVPDGEQLSADYPGYQYRQSLQMPPGDHPVYAESDMLALQRENAELLKLLREAEYALTSTEETCLAFVDLRGRIKLAIDAARKEKS